MKNNIHANVWTRLVDWGIVKKNVNIVALLCVASNGEPLPPHKKNSLKWHIPLLFYYLENNRIHSFADSY